MKNNRIIVLMASIICLPLLGILPEHPNQHKRKDQHEAQPPKKRRKVKFTSLPITTEPLITTVTTTTTALPTYLVY